MQQRIESNDIRLTPVHLPHLVEESDGVSVSAELRETVEDDVVGVAVDGDLLGDEVGVVGDGVAGLVAGLEGGEDDVVGGEVGADAVVRHALADFEGLEPLAAAAEGVDQVVVGASGGGDLGFQS